MTIHRKFILLFAICILSLTSYAQPQAQAVDSMKYALKQAKTVEEKIYWLDLVSKTLMNVNLKEADEYGRQMIELAEESRNRKLMIEAYLSNGTRCSYFAGQQDYLTRSIGYYNKALDIAKQNKMDDMKGGALIKLAYIHLNVPDNDKALAFVNQAATAIASLKNDSLQVELENGYGSVYVARNDKILGLSHFLNALRIAEEIEGTAAPKLLRSCYVNLSNFYTSIEDFDKALDYQMLAMKKLDEMTEKFVPYQRAIDMNSIGKLFSYKKNDDIAVSYFTRSIAMADSLKFSSLKVPAYISILEQYMRSDKPEKALDYFNSADGQNLKSYMNQFGFGANVDMSYGSIFSKMGKYDSAKYYFQKASAFYEKSLNQFGRMYFYNNYAYMYKRMGDTKNAIEKWVLVKEISEKIGQLEMAENAAKQLDTLYQKEGNFQQANLYNSIYYKFKDSLQILSKEKELAQLEAADVQQRQAREEREEEEKKVRRNNIQYLAITVGIAVLFIALVVLGMFKVSATTIKMIGFFVFIMLFEFIFLLFKTKIKAITHGEPLKDLLFMIGLAALLLPLHHWLEEKAIHYLTSHNRLTAAGMHLRTKLFRRKREH
jgi:tetratricopeptide (TPR) repeat protein